MWWIIHGGALGKRKPAARQVINKFIFKQLATNTREQQIHKYRSKICETCGLQDKDNDHVMQCTHQLRLDECNALTKAANDYLLETHTPEGVRKYLMFGLLPWYNKIEIPSLQEYISKSTFLLKAAYKDQKTIGWHQIIQGRQSCSWEKIITQNIEAGNRN